MTAKSRTPEPEPMPELTAYDRRWVSWQPRVAVERGRPAPFDRDAAVRAYTQTMTRPWWERGFPVPPAMEHDEAVFWSLALTAHDGARPPAYADPATLALADVVERLFSTFGSDGWFTDPATALLMRPLANLFEAATLLELVLDEASDDALRSALALCDRLNARAARNPMRSGRAYRTLYDGEGPWRRSRAARRARGPRELDSLPPEGSLLRAALRATDRRAERQRERLGAPRHVPPRYADEQFAGRIRFAADLRARAQAALAGSFCDHVAPYLGESEFAAGAARVTSALARYGDGPAPPYLYHLAAAFRLAGEVAPFVASLRGGDSEQSRLVDGHHLAFALGSRRAVLAEAQRLALRLPGAQAVREWLALTGRDGIAYAARQASYAGSNPSAWIDALGTVETIDTAAVMLGLATRTGLEDAAKAWLDRHPDVAIPAAAAAAEAGRRIDAAVDTLKRAVANGRAAAVEAALGERLRAMVLGAPGTTASSWLDDSPAARTPVRWLYADALPPLVAGGRVLEEQQVLAIVNVLRASTLVARDPRIAAVREHVDAADLERFALALFQQWLRAGADAKDKWALHAVGIFGGDAAATALVPHVRRWPGESQHARAVVGLECLRAIGSDIALTQIAGLAQKLPFAALKRRANECMEDIARERGLSRDRLEDRIVPSLDLDGGERRFVLSTGTFTASVDGALAPVLRNAAGKAVRDLPARVDGEPEADDAARSEWKLFKRQLRDTAAIQRDRLEAAMVAQRSWFLDEFRTLLVAHPITGTLARALLWTAETPERAELVLFRVRDDGTPVDAADAAVSLAPAAVVRIVHRLEIGEDALDAWESRFAALGIAQPFPQLDRVTYRLDAFEIDDTAIRRFDGATVAEPTFLARLKKRGWQRGTPADGGAYTHHWKRFDKAGVTAMLAHGMVTVGYVQPENEIAIEGCSFVRGPAEHRPHGASGVVPLRDVSAVAISEVCSDCAFVLS